MFSKAAQTSKTVILRKECEVCKKSRETRFFSSKRARICGDCKRRAWATKLKNSPGKVNKTRDKNWAYLVKELAGNKCEFCGKTEHLNSHHIFSRSSHNLRWDVTNGIALCSGHHTLKSDFSAHKTPADFVEWIKEYRGLEWYEDLRRRAKSIEK
jgi:hypothetical protein